MSRITNDVNQVQQAVSETIGDLLREGLSLVGLAAYLFYLDARLALVAVTGAPLVVYPLIRFGKRIRSTTRRSQEHLEHLSHVTAEAFTGHRIVKAFGAEGHEERRFRQASQRLYRTNLKVTSALALLPPLMELLGGFAVVGLDLVRQPSDCRKGAQRRRLRRLRRGGVHDVRADQKAEPRQCDAAAGDGGIRTDLRDSRHAFGSARAAGRAAPHAAPAGDRFSQRELLVRRRQQDDSEGRVVQRSGRTSGRDCGIERRRKDHARESRSAGSTTSPAGRSSSTASTCAT